MNERYITNLELSNKCKSRFIEVRTLDELKKVEFRNHYIAQGAGLSYSDASFGQNITTVNFQSFNNIIFFDKINKTVEVESGCTLKKIFENFVNENLYLTVQPGWPDLCIGSLIASNVHGKNTYKFGNFKNIVISLKLFHPDYGVINCSREENHEIFNLTVGGMGLTGLIISAVLKLEELGGNVCSKKITKISSFEEIDEIFQKEKDKNDTMMSWANLSNPKKFNALVVMTNTYFKKNFKIKIPKYKKIFLSPDKLRFNLFHKFINIPLNTLYYNQQLILKKHEVDIFPELFPFYNKSFYFDMFGRKGFLSFQLIIPRSNFLHFINEFKKLMIKYDVSIVLTLIKLFKGNQNFLNFSMDGISIYCDLPNNSNNNIFVKTINDVCHNYGCINNIFRNHLLSEKNVINQFGEQYFNFKEKLNKFDKNRIFNSALSQRLGLDK